LVIIPLALSYRRGFWGILTSHSRVTDLSVRLSRYFSMWRLPCMTSSSVNVNRFLVPSHLYRG